MVAPPFSITPGRTTAVNSMTKNLRRHFHMYGYKDRTYRTCKNFPTQAFIDMFNHSISRLSICSVLYSDNGTQFVGATWVMNQDLQSRRNIYVNQHKAFSGMQWKFITSAALHHRGLWEAALRLAKKHLYRTIFRQIIRFNQLSTLLVWSEACLNSRLLFPLHYDPSGSFTYTPGDFLSGRPLNSRPEQPVVDMPIIRPLYSQQLQKALLEALET